jgi:hypothetical protein
MMNFYRRFLPGIANMLRPLTAVLSGNPKALPWKPDKETAFAAAKAALIAAVPLAHPLPGGCSRTGYERLRHPHLSSPTTTGRQPLGFFCKKLSKTKVNYSTFDRELLAAVSGIKHF